MARKSFVKFECLVLAISICFGMLALTGCDQSKATEVSEESGQITESDIKVNDPDPTATPTPTPSPTPAPMTDAEAEPEALKIAEEVGLSKEELRGKYALFLRYSHVLECNPKINEYRNYLYKYFPVVADHLKSENEEMFLRKVISLEMYTVKTDDYAGGYLGNTITFNSNNVKYWGDYYQSLVIYHELMHFIDGNIDGEVGEVYIMKDETLKFVPYSDEYLIDQDAVLYHSQMGYFVEGGAEKYKHEYFSAANEEPYSTGVEFLVGLEYIFGKEALDDMYFSRDTNAKFCNLMKDYGFSTDEIIRMLRTSVTDKTMKDAKQYIDPREVLIRFYTQKIGPDYAKDKIFCRIIACMDNGIINKIPTEYRSFITKVTKDAGKQTNGMLNQVRKKTGNKNGHFEAKPFPLYIDGGLKLVAMFTTYKKEKPVYTSVTFDYDFENKSVKEIKLTNSWKLEKSKGQVKLPREEADALVETLYKDNSEAHNQTVLGKNPELTIQYKKAEELGNKYGVYIWFDDLTPEGVLFNEDTAAKDPVYINDTLTKIENVLSLYPEDYFDQLLFKYYDGVAICLYEGLTEEAFPDSYYSDGKFYLMFYVNITQVDRENVAVFYPGSDHIVAQYRFKIDPKVVLLIGDIWNRTEKIIAFRNAYYEKPVWTGSNWTSMNYKGFKYLGNKDRTKLTEYEKKIKKQYFINFGALYSAENDRVITYEYMMLYTLTGEKPDGLTKESLAKIKEIKNIIRQEFDTTNWPDFTSWERAMMKL